MAILPIAMLLPAIICLLLAIEPAMGLRMDVTSRIRKQDKVPLDLFVMSRCPDALACEARINDVIKTMANITDVRPACIYAML